MIVSNVHGREVGLLGAMPVDVIEAKVTIDQTTHRQKGISGSTIIRDKTTLLADVYELVESVYPEWKREETAEQPENGKKGSSLTVLLAEDSDFFRSQVKKYLEDAGFSVIDAPDGERAWELLCDNIDAVKIVVTDIEMPRLNGLELTRRIRGDERTRGLPIIAVTTLAGDEEVAKGKAAGVTSYHVKLDRDRLVESVREYAAAAA